MCTGFEIAALALTAAGTTATLYAQDTAANAQQAQAESQALQAEADAKAARGAAEVEAARIRKQTQRERASAIAAASAAGVDVSSPTALRITEGITKAGEEDAIMTIFNADAAGRSLNREASGYRIAGKNAKTAGRLNQVSSLISGGSQMAAYGNDAWKRAQATRGTD